MQYSKDVQKIVMPITVVWLALCASLLVYGLVLVTGGKTAMVDVRDMGNLTSILMPLSFLPFVFTFIFHKKLKSIVRPNNMERSPYAKGLNEEDKNILSQYGSYFVVHIILWALNEAGAIFGFVLSFTTGNISYYLYPASIALFLNLVIMRPNYYAFIKGQRFE